MKLALKRRYYTTSRRGREPIRYHVRQPKGVGTTVHGVIYMDPVLRRHSNADLRKALVGHEVREIRAWGAGKLASHSKARNQEPALTKKIGGVSGFWKEISRREGK